MKYNSVIKALSGLIFLLALGLFAFAAGALAKIIIKLFLIGFNSIGGPL